MLDEKSPTIEESAQEKDPSSPLKGTPHKSVVAIDVVPTKKKEDSPNGGSATDKWNNGPPFLTAAEVGAGEDEDPEETDILESLLVSHGNTGKHNAAEKEALMRRRAEAEQRQREANEETTRSEDLRNFLQEMHEKRNQELQILQRQKHEEMQMQYSVNPSDASQLQQELDIYALAADLVTVEPPDGGWGWLVVLGSFFCMITVDGICFNYGVFLVDMRTDDFVSDNMGLTTLPGSILTGAYLLIGPLASALANQFDYRPVAMAGSLLSAVAFLASSYIYNFALFTIIYGLLGGIGFGLIYLPAIATVGHWFQSRRPLAVGLALCGSGIGTFIFGMTIPYMLEEFTWRGTLIILATFSLQCMVSAVLFRPLELHLRLKHLAHIRRILCDIRHEEEAVKRQEQQRLAEQERQRRKAEKERAKKKKKAKQKRIVIHRGSIMQRIIEEKRRQRTTSMGSLDGMVITRDNQLIDAQTDAIDLYISTSAINRIADSVAKKVDSRRGKLGGSSLASSGSFNSKQGGFSLLTNSQTASRQNSLTGSQVKASMPQLVQDYIHSQVSLNQPNPQYSKANSSTASGSLSTLTTGTGLLNAPGRDFTVSTTPNNQANTPSESETASNVQSDGPSLDSKLQDNVSLGQQAALLLDDDTKAEIQTQLRKEMLRPQYKKDIFFGGSIQQLEQITADATKSSTCSSISTLTGTGSIQSNDLRHQRSQQSLTGMSLGGNPYNTTGADDVTSGGGGVGVINVVGGTSSSPMRSYIEEMLDVGILKSPTFLLMILSSVSGMLGFFIPFHFLPLSITARGISLVDAGRVISYVGVANTVGRLVATMYIERGWASQYPWADYLWINNASLLLAGVSAFLMPVCGDNYHGLVVVACIYGICIAAFVSLKSILVVELLGLERLTNAFGYLLIFQGMAAIIGQPIAGAIFEACGKHHDRAFQLAGAAILLSGLLCFPLRYVATWEQKRWEEGTLQGGFHYATARDNESDLEGGGISVEGAGGAHVMQTSGNASVQLTSSRQGSRISSQIEVEDTPIQEKEDKTSDEEEEEEEDLEDNDDVIHEVDEEAAMLEDLAGSGGGDNHHVLKDLLVTSTDSATVNGHHEPV